MPRAVGMPRVVVLDHGSGNLRSAERALARVGADVTVSADLDRAAEADGLVVPGVGAFAACMAGIEALGAGPVIAERVAAGRPVLGICVGMQVLFEYGDEHGVVTKGLGLLPGGVVRLDAPVLPHMGWNVVDWPAHSRLFAGVAPGTRFYFVHSYAAPPPSGDHRWSRRPRRTACRSSPRSSAARSAPPSSTRRSPGTPARRSSRNWVARL